MGDFSSGFWTGLMNSVSEGIERRTIAGEEYFAKQYELARTRGLENKARTDAAMQQGLTSARQLMQMGAPEDLVMAIANQNPDDIPDIAAKVAQLQADGVQTDETFFRDLIQVSQDFDNGGEDINSLFKRMYEPLRRNIKADPEGFKNDQRGSIWATLFGYDAMQQSMDKLDRTEVIDGMTAGDLLAYPSTPTPGQPLGQGAVTLNYNLYGDSIRTARAARSGGSDELSVNETAKVHDTFQELYTQKRSDYEASTGGSVTPEVETNLKRETAQELVDLWGADVIQQVPPVWQFIRPPEEKRKEAPASPPMPSDTALPSLPAVGERKDEETKTPLIQRRKREEEKVAPEEVPTIGLPGPKTSNMSDMFVLPTGDVIVKMLEDGTVVLRGPDGKLKRMKQESVLSIIGN